MQHKIAFCQMHSGESALLCRDAARCQRLLAMNVVRQLVRSNERYCRRALTAWRQAAQAQRTKRAVLTSAVQRMAAAKARAALHSWAQYAQERRLRHQRHTHIIQKVGHSPSHQCN